MSFGPQECCSRLLPARAAAKLTLHRPATPRRSAYRGPVGGFLTWGRGRDAPAARAVPHLAPTRGSPATSTPTPTRHDSGYVGYDGLFSSRRAAATPAVTRSRAACFRDGLVGAHLRPATGSALTRRELPCAPATPCPLMRPCARYVRRRPQGSSISLRVLPTASPSTVEAVHLGVRLRVFEEIQDNLGRLLGPAADGARGVAELALRVSCDSRP